MYRTGNSENRSFSVLQKEDHITTNKIPISFCVGKEIPYKIAYWLPDDFRPDDELTPVELEKLKWIPYQSNLVVDLGSNKGTQNIWFVAKWRFPKHYIQVERFVEIEEFSPTINILSPTSRGAAQPLLQIQGYCSGLTRELYYDVSNSVGFLKNQDAYEDKREGWNPQKSDWTQFYFHANDVSLAYGTNLITVHCIVAGNQLSTNIEVVYSTNAPTGTLR